MTSTTDNRTTELLREGLTEHGIEWRSGLEGVTFVGDWCFVEYDNGKLAATCEPVLTPEQAIAATLGSHPTKSGRGYYTDRDDEGTHIMCDDCGGYIGTAEEIAATLGIDRHPYEQRITGDGSDWGEIMCGAYDDLMANACESCTPEQMERLANYICAELNARAERTCKFVSSKGSDYPPVCSACGYELGIYDCEWFDDGTYGYDGNFCPNCGAKVVGE